jgi:dihydrodipicolinate synthase/N-acetylneuraminate lyase
VRQRRRAIRGPLFAAPTPFDASGDICLPAFHDFLDFLTAGGVDALVVNGTTGEFPSLDRDERQNLFEAARRRFHGVVVNNISSTNAREANAFARHSSGADALLILPPYYYAGVTDEGLIDFFREGLEGVETPVFLYNFPRHVKLSLTPALVEKIIAACDVIVGVKDSSGDLDIAGAFKNLVGVRQVFVGKDSKALAALEAGLAGSITGAGNPFPEFLVRLRRAWAAGEALRAQRLQQNFDLWNDFRATLRADEPALVKAALARRLPGYPIHVRPPLRALDASEQAALMGMIDRLTEIVRRTT